MPVELTSKCCWFQFLPTREEKSGQESVGLVLVGLFGFFVVVWGSFGFGCLFSRRTEKPQTPLSSLIHTLTHTPFLTHIYTHTHTQSQENSTTVAEAAVKPSSSRWSRTLAELLFILPFPPTSHTWEFVAVARLLFLIMMQDAQ